MTTQLHVVVIGAGVIGLSTAIKIQELGYRVTILAEHLPGDRSIKYTSYWAGAHHLTATDDPYLLDIHKKTFEIMWEMSEDSNPAAGCFMRTTLTEFYVGKDNNILEFMPEHRKLAKEELRLDSVTGETFKTVTIDTPVYLQWLLAKFLGAGGQLKRVQLQHVLQAASGAYAKQADAVVVCAGLGARFLGGVEDTEMYPIRGQTVLINAPWIKAGRGMDAKDEGLWTYIIPRRSGDVILGGTKLDNEWHPEPIPSITQGILERCLKLYPELVPPEKRTEGKTPSVEDLKPLIIEEGCGLRPARKSGLRIEKDYLQIEGMGHLSRKIPLVHNYGHAGFGYQSSWGTAIQAAQLLDEALRPNTIS